MKRLIPKRFHRAYNFLDQNGGFIAFLIVIIVGVVGVWVVRNQNDQNTKAIKQATLALCNFKSFYARQVRNSQDFLKDHPNGITGISRELIIKGINDNQHRLNQLRVIKCPPDIENPVPQGRH